MTRSGKQYCTWQIRPVRQVLEGNKRKLQQLHLAVLNPLLAVRVKSLGGHRGRQVRSILSMSNSLSLSLSLGGPCHPHRRFSSFLFPCSPCVYSLVLVVRILPALRFRYWVRTFSKVRRAADRDGCKIPDSLALKGCDGGSCSHQSDERRII